MAKVLVVTAKEETERSDVLDVLRCRNSVVDALSSNGYNIGILEITKEDINHLNRLEAKILRHDPDCIFNLFEGFSDDSTKEVSFAIFLESLKIPFTGNGSMALYASLDKFLAKKLLAMEGVPVPQGVYLKHTVGNVIDLPCPAFIKPRFEDGSVGIDETSLVTSKEELNKALPHKLSAFPAGIIVEEFLEGREFNVGLVGVPPYEVVGISMIDYKDYPDVMPFLDYRAKWDTNSPGYKISPENPKIISDVAKERLIWIAKRAGITLSCRGYFRVDLREKDGRLYVIDVNPNPDLNVDSGLANQSRRSGLSYEALVSYLVEIALKENLYEPAKQAIYEVPEYSAI